jgi:hypothetical protein
MQYILFLHNIKLTNDHLDSSQTMKKVADNSRLIINSEFNIIIDLFFHSIIKMYFYCNTLNFTNCVERFEATR